MIVISPAKNLNISPEDYLLQPSDPLFSDKTNRLINLMKTMSSKKLKDLMNISDNLAQINFQRFINFNHKNNIFKPSGFLFSGDTFNGLSIRSFTKEKLDLAQKKLRIISGLYGLLRPLDLIQPYRLEMGTKISSQLGRSLPNFWMKDITNSLNNDLKKTKSEFLFNLSSEEYFQSIDINLIKVKVINFSFKKIKNKKVANVGMMIKKYRGQMAKFIISNNISNLNDLKYFNEDGFKFDSFDDLTNRLFFINK